MINGRVVHIMKNINGGAHDQVFVLVVQGCDMRQNPYDKTLYSAPTSYDEILNRPKKFPGAPIMTTTTRPLLAAHPGASLLKARLRNNTLNVAINLSNSLLLSKKSPHEEAGVAVDVANLLARTLGVDLKIRPYAHPNLVCDAAAEWRSTAVQSPQQDIFSKPPPWDVGLLASEKSRAQLLSFSRPYCEIPAVLCVRWALCEKLGIQIPPVTPAQESSPDTTLLDSLYEKQVKLVSKFGGAYDLWLMEHYGGGGRDAQDLLIREKTNEAAVQRFVSDPSVVAIAGLKAVLDMGVLAQSGQLKDSFVLVERPFMSVRQGLALIRGHADERKSGVEDDEKVIVQFLDAFVEDVVKTGEVKKIVDKWNKGADLAVCAKL